VYIGKPPTVGNFQACDAISVVNGQAAYTLQVGGTNVAPESAQHCLVSLNGVLQAPISSYTISGSTLTFAANLATGDSIDFITILGDVLDIGAPSDDTVTAAKLNNDIISGTTALTSAPDDTDELLISDAGTLKRIDYSLLKTSNTPAFHAYNNADQNISASTLTQVIFNTEIYDTASAFASNQFTVPTGQGGKYFVYFRLGFASGTDLSFQVTVQIDSAFNADSGFRVNQMNDYYDNAFSGQVLDLAAGEVARVMIYQGDSTVNISGTENRANFGAFKIIE